MVVQRKMARSKVQHTITLYLGEGGYLARHSDPSVKRLLGTDTLPTVFTQDADPHTVLAEIQRLNPGRLVKLADPLTQPSLPSNSLSQAAPIHSERSERPTGEAGPQQATRASQPMSGRTHILGAMALYGSAAILAEMPFDLGTAAMAGFCGLLPDVDTRASTLGRLVSPLSGTIERRWGHRTATHAYLGQLTFALLALPLLFWLGKPLYLAAVIGYMSHPFLDTMTVEGVRLFWPWSEVRCVFPYYEGRPHAYRTRTGSKGDKALCAVFAVCLVPILLLKVATYERVIRVVQADAASAVRDYLEMGTDHLVYVDLTAEDPASGRKLSGRFEAVGSEDYHTLLVRDEGGTIYSVGKPYEANFRAITAVCERGRTVRVSSRTVAMSERLVADLEALIPVDVGGRPVRHFLSGTLQVEETVEVTPDPHRFSPVRSAGPMVYLRYATLADLERYDLSSELVKQGSVTIRLFFFGGEGEYYRAGDLDRRRLRRITVAFERGLQPRLLIHKGDSVATGDTLAVLSGEAIALARRRLDNLTIERHALRSDPAPASQEKALQAAEHRLDEAEAGLRAVQSRYRLGFASDAELAEADAAYVAAIEAVELMQRESERLRGEQRRRGRILDEEIEAARLRLKETSGKGLLTSPVAGRVERIEQRVTSGDRRELRILISTQLSPEATIPAAGTAVLSDTAHALSHNPVPSQPTGNRP